MSYSAKVLADSVTDNGVRLTTLEVSMPKFIVAEFNTHRTFSRNSASSRAIPVNKILEKVTMEPFIPTNWGRNQPGMQAGNEIAEPEKARALWKEAAISASWLAECLLELGVHKQLTNRLLEPFMWTKIIVSATEWSNFFALRRHEAAQPEIRIPAELMKWVYDNSEPEYVKPGHWHLPLVPDLAELTADGYGIMDIVKISAGRCCRVSYLTHDKLEPKKDIERCDRLIRDGHMSPLEHPAKSNVGLDTIAWNSNFRGWTQYRKMIPYEHDFSLIANG